MTRQNEPDRLPREPGLPPSDRSVGRLRAELTAELADLRDAVGDELRLVQVLRDAGEVDAARLLLDRPSRRLEVSRQRLRDLVARAAVERAAEGVLAGVRDGAEPRPRLLVSRLRRAPLLLAGAVAVALVMVVSPPDVRAPTPPHTATLGVGAATTPGTDAGTGPPQATAPPPVWFEAGEPAPHMTFAEVVGARPAGGDLTAGPAPRPPTVLLGLLEPAALALRGATHEAASAAPPFATSATSSLAGTSDGGSRDVADRGSGDVPGGIPPDHEDRDDGMGDRVADESTRSVPPADGDAGVPLGDPREAVERDDPGDPGDADVVSGVDGR